LLRVPPLHAQRHFQLREISMLYQQKSAKQQLGKTPTATALAAPTMAARSGSDQRVIRIRCTKTPSAPIVNSGEREKKRENMHTQRR
jgi:hypothetical protein